jgi:hypothetical protein
MGVDPISLGLLFGGATALAGPAAGVVAAGGAAAAGLLTNKKKDKNGAPVPVGPAPTPVEQTGTSVGKKTRKYREPAQLFTDNDLRLGAGGMLGRIG